MKEKLMIWIAWHLPKSLVKWAAVRVFAYASSTAELSNKAAGSITCFDATNAWNKQP